MPRVALEALVRAPFGNLRVTTTHLEYYSHEHRAAQIGRLRAAHAESCAERTSEKEAGPFVAEPRSTSALVCGDFNMRPEDSLHGVMTLPVASGLPRFVDAWRASHPGEPHPPTFHVHEEEREAYCCDYVFVTEDLLPRLRSVRVDGATRASDHQPVIVELD